MLLQIVTAKTTLLQNGFDGGVETDRGSGGCGALRRWLRIRGRLGGSLFEFGQHAVGSRQRYFRPLHLLSGLNHEVLLYIFLEIRVGGLERQRYGLNFERIAA